MKARIHAFEPRSRANGPGRRAVIWFQGCTLACRGCFNPATHATGTGLEAETAELAAKVLALRGARESIEGVTLTGGEPLEQPAACADLLDRLAGSGLGVVLFTGFAPRAPGLVEPGDPAAHAPLCPRGLRARAGARGDHPRRRLDHGDGHRVGAVHHGCLLRVRVKRDSPVTLTNSAVSVLPSTTT